MNNRSSLRHRILETFLDSGPTVELFRPLRAGAHGPYSCPSHGVETIPADFWLGCPAKENDHSSNISAQNSQAEVVKVLGVSLYIHILMCPHHIPRVPQTFSQFSSLAQNPSFLASHHVLGL